MEPPHVTTVSLVESNSNPGGVQLVNSHQANRMGDPNDLVELAAVVQKGNEFVRANATNKLTVIAEQIKFLQEQAHKALEEAKKDSDLHHAACNIVKKPGTMYHMYKRESGQKYLSILSPKEWGASCPHEHLGSWRLEYDMSWTPLADVQKKSEQLALMDKVLNSQLAITDVGNRK